MSPGQVDPIVDDDETIAAALEDLSISALMASVVQITGDPSYLRGAIRPRQFIQNEFQGKLSDEERGELRRDAAKAICAWRDAGCPAPAPVSRQLISETMDWIACEHIPDDYAEMYYEEMDLNGDNPRAIDLGRRNVDSQNFSVLIIGYGVSGLLAGIRLKEAGIPFEIVDKNGDVGGTWLDNTYPGCRVDVASHYYSYSFERNDYFSEYYAQQPELHRYFRDLSERHGIGDHVSWHQEVDRAVWDEDTAVWQVTTRAPDGAVRTRQANAVISGVGILSRPHVPDIPNLDRFTGPVFHAAQWDHSVDLEGKKVALLGAGASGFQIGPAIVDAVASLTVFQRTPQWMAPNPRYRRRVQPTEKWAMRHLPGYARWFRFMLMWQSNDRILELVRTDPEWPDFPRTANAQSAARRELFANWIEHEVGDDPELVAKVTPNYPPMAKRMLQDDGSWLRCLKRAHVDLVTDRILDVDETALVTADGRYEADVIVLATGFRASEVLWPMEIIGRDGVSLTELWNGAPAAYRGVSVAGFPNFFIMAGPGTGLAHAGSVITMAECEMRYVGDALRTLIEGNHRSIEPTSTAYAHYRDRLQSEVRTLMWGHPSIEHSWYKAADGNVYVLCPWRLVDYWQMTLRVDPDDHLIT